MLLKSTTRRRPALWLAALLIAGACTAGVDQLSKPVAAPGGRASDVVSTPSTGLVISQIYGGGGNGGSVYKNDFIELYNGSSTTVSLAGWSVQYASAAGTSWQVTNLTGTIQPGQYYLVQEAVGAGGTTNLPTPDATGAIAMSATAGKVALVNTTTALSGSGCPFGSSTVDFIGFGTTASCVEGTTVTANLSNTTAAVRKDGGRQDTNDNSADFTTNSAPAPRNTGSPFNPPLNTLTATIAPNAPAVANGATVNFTVSAAQGGSPVTANSAAWTSSNEAVATIDPATGVATALSLGTTTIGVTATTSSGNASATTTLTVSGTPATVTVSPATWTLKSGQSKTFTATAADAGSNPVSTTYSWSSSNPSIATIDASTGAAVGHAVGQATITATTPNNVSGTATITVTAGNVSLQARTDPLPTGFQTQVFVNSGSTDANGAAVTSTNVTWSSSNTAILTANPTTGVITAKSAGTANVIATANSDGVSSGSTAITVDVEPVGAGARVGHNTELGTPTDADPSDDVIIARRQYTLSYNVAHHGPNWVSWNLDATHTGGASRCNCFTADTALTRLGITAYDTQDWVNGGQYSRGHMSPSADWADAAGDNAPTFFLSNMLPQNQTANAGAWGDLENYLRTRTGGGAEIYIVAGGIFTKNRSGAGIDGLGYTTGTGHIAVPDSIWKIAVIVPDSRSASGIGSPSDVTVIAVNTPNSTDAVGSWSNFTTTVDKLQRSTGYDFLNALPESVQCRLETRNCAPVAAIAAVSGAQEGSAVTFDASGSTDADNDALSYAWTFGDGSTGSGVAPSHTYADNGTYSVSVTVTDGHGGSGTIARSVSVANVAPVPTMSPTTTTVRAGVAFSPQGLFTDAGTRDATWHAVFTWGDGTSLTANIVSLPTAPIRASKAYSVPGTYTVRFTVTDKDGGSAYTERTVIVTP
jgi:DNA/RNA endonuclease G (NUC1)